jgi:hypothetical protein
MSATGLGDDTGLADRAASVANLLYAFATAADFG